MLLTARLLSADGKRVLFEDQIMYNPVFSGIDEEHWPLVRQVVAEVHDGDDGRVARLTADLERRGFRVTAIQDDLYVGTDIHNLYATKEQ